LPFCPNCGTSHPNDAAYCPSCGTPVGGAITHTPRYAGFWIRVLPWLIDYLLIVVPLGALYSLLGLHHGTGLTRTHQAGGTFVSVGLYIRGPADVLTIFLAWLYFAVQESSAAQATIGKRFFRLSVTDTEGERISFRRASGRYFAKVMSTVILLIGYLMAGWTQRKQGLHDLLARTLVVRTRG
jgi:uncharacterized RDD family membrane protein YckC